MAQKPKFTIEELITALWQVRRDKYRQEHFGICSLLKALHSVDMAKSFCNMVRLMPRELKWGHNYLFEMYDWKQRDRFLDLFIKELCKKYNIVHP